MKLVSGEGLISGASMSGDSPTSRGEHLLELKDLNVGIPVKQMLDTGVQCSIENLYEPPTLRLPPSTSSVATQVAKHSFDQQGPRKRPAPPTPTTPTSEEKRSIPPGDDTVRLEETPLVEPAPGSSSMAVELPSDTVPVAESLPEKKQINQEEDEECLIKCLYYSLECCECSIQ